LLLVAVLLACMLASAAAIRVTVYVDATCQTAAPGDDAQQQYDSNKCYDRVGGSAMLSLQGSCARDDARNVDIVTLKTYTTVNCGGVQSTTSFTAGQCTLAPLFGTGRYAVVDCSAANARAAVSALLLAVLAYVATAFKL
jgi:hypothetical protein